MPQFVISEQEFERVSNYETHIVKRSYINGCDITSLHVINRYGKLLYTVCREIEGNHQPEYYSIEEESK